MNGVRKAVLSGLATAAAAVAASSYGVAVVAEPTAAAPLRAPAETAYVADAGSGTVTPISTATNQAGPAIKTGASPWAIAITP